MTLQAMPRQPSEYLLEQQRDVDPYDLRRGIGERKLVVVTRALDTTAMKKPIEYLKRVREPAL